MNIHTKEHSPSQIWNKAALTQAFNEEVAFRAAAACKEIWRKETPVLWSNRHPDKRDDEHYPWKIWHYGLFGLEEESSSPIWSKWLNDEEAERSAAYATIETDGFPPWLSDLATTHPDVVASVLGDEIDRELLLADDESHLPLLSAVASHADSSIKQLLKSRLYAALLRWDSTISEKNSSTHLNQVIKVINDTAEADEREILAEKCDVRFSKEPNGPLALSWLTGLFRFDPLQGFDAIEQTLNTVNDSERKKMAVRLFNETFYHHLNSLSPHNIAINNQSARVNFLKRLLQYAYKYIHQVFI